MDRNIRTISLEGRLAAGGALSFHSVEVPVIHNRWIPFALVRYSQAGEMQSKALRLDLDKRTFADDLEGQHEMLQTMGAQIADIVAKELRRIAFENIQKGILKAD